MGRLVALLGLHEVGQDVDWQREHNGGVLLRRDGVQRLEVAQLQGGRRVSDHLGGFAQGPGCLLFTLGGNHLGAGFTGGFRFGCHGTLQLDGQTDVLAVVGGGREIKVIVITYIVMYSQAILYVFVQIIVAQLLLV